MIQFGMRGHDICPKGPLTQVLDALRWAEREDLLISAPGAKSAPNEGCPRADVVNYLYLNLGDGGTPR